MTPLTPHLSPSILTHPLTLAQLATLAHTPPPHHRPPPPLDHSIDTLTCTQHAHTLPAAYHIILTQMRGYSRQMLNLELALKTVARCRGHLPGVPQVTMWERGAVGLNLFWLAPYSTPI